MGFIIDHLAPYTGGKMDLNEIFRGGFRRVSNLPTKLNIFDFDKTIFLSPDKPEDWPVGMEFGGRPESIGTTSEGVEIVPDKPGMEWYRKDVVNSARQCLSDPNALTILMTGRPKSVERRIIEILANVGLHFKNHIYCVGNGTLKPKTLSWLLEKPEFQGISSIEAWDDHDLEMIKTAIGNRTWRGNPYNGTDQSPHEHRNQIRAGVESLKRQLTPDHVVEQDPERQESQSVKTALRLKAIASKIM